MAKKTNTTVPQTDTVLDEMDDIMAGGSAAEVDVRTTVAEAQSGYHFDGENTISIEIDEFLKEYTNRYDPSKTYKAGSIILHNVACPKVKEPKMVTHMAGVHLILDALEDLAGPHAVYHYMEDGLVSKYPTRVLDHYNRQDGGETFDGYVRGGTYHEIGLNGHTIVVDATDIAPGGWRGFSYDTVNWNVTFGRKVFDSGIMRTASFWTRRPYKDTATNQIKWQWVEAHPGEDISDIPMNPHDPSVGSYTVVPNSALWSARVICRIWALQTLGAGCGSLELKIGPKTYNALEFAKKDMALDDAEYGELQSNLQNIGRAQKTLGTSASREQTQGTEGVTVRSEQTHVDVWATALNEQNRTVLDKIISTHEIDKLPAGDYHAYDIANPEAGKALPMSIGSYFVDAQGSYFLKGYKPYAELIMTQAVKFVPQGRNGR